MDRMEHCFEVDDRKVSPDPNTIKVCSWNSWLWDDPASRLPFGAKKGLFSGTNLLLAVSFREGLGVNFVNFQCHNSWLVDPPETALTFDQVAAPWKQRWWLRKNWLHLLPVSMSPWNQRGWKEGNLHVTYGSGYTLHIKKIHWILCLSKESSFELWFSRADWQDTPPKLWKEAVKTQSN